MKRQELNQHGILTSSGVFSEQPDYPKQARRMRNGISMLGNIPGRVSIGLCWKLLLPHGRQVQPFVTLNKQQLL